MSRDNPTPEEITAKIAELQKSFGDRFSSIAQFKDLSLIQSLVLNIPSVDVLKPTNYANFYSYYNISRAEYEGMIKIPDLNQYDDNNGKFLTFWSFNNKKKGILLGREISNYIISNTDLSLSCLVIIYHRSSPSQSVLK